MKTVDVVFKLVKPIAEKLQFNIWDVRFEKEGCNRFLKVYICKDIGFVTLDDCETVTRFISCGLDRVDPIDKSYYLNVAVVGPGRRLIKAEHFLKFLGSKITVKLYKSFDGKKKFSGILRSYENSKIKVETEDELLVILLDSCSYVKLDDYEKFNLN